MHVPELKPRLFKTLWPKLSKKIAKHFVQVLTKKLQSVLIKKVDSCISGTVCYKKKFSKEFLKKVKQVTPTSLALNSFSN